MPNQTEQAPADLQAEIERQRTELLRLRDLLIARDAELGQARGRMAELEARSTLLLRLLVLLRARAPKFVRAGYTRLRKRQQG